MKRVFAIAALLMMISQPGLADSGEGDSDEAFDNAVRGFGYAGGAAWQCSPASDRTAIERQALQAFNGLTRLFGSDQAFFFATSFGAGTMDEIKKEDCGNHVETFARGMKKAQRAD